MEGALMFILMSSILHYQGVKQKWRLKIPSLGNRFALYENEKLSWQMYMQN